MSRRKLIVPDREREGEEGEVRKKSGGKIRGMEWRKREVGNGEREEDGERE